LSLGKVSSFRTYVGIGKSTTRLGELLRHYAGRFARAIDVAKEIVAKELPTFRLNG